MTNQGLSKSTTGETALTALANRNDESLEIAETDKITISYVQGGKTYSTQLDVADEKGNVKTLQEVFQAAEDINDGDKIFANKANESYVKASLGVTTGTEVSKAISDNQKAIKDKETTDTKKGSAAIKAAKELSTALKTKATSGDSGNKSVANRMTEAGAEYASQIGDSAAAAVKYIDAVKAAKGNDAAYTDIEDKMTAASTANGEYSTAHKDYLKEAGVVLLSKGHVGVAASNDMVDTADGENAITLVAGKGGVFGQISGLNISVTDSEGNVKKSVNAAFDGFTESVRAMNKSEDNAITLQVGAKANQAIKVGLTDMRSEALGLKGSDGTKLNISTQTKANAAINVLDNALQKALDQQTTIGSVESRLSYTSSNLTTASENVQASESTIRDADMAKEMTEYTKNNVLLQAAQSMLAQANQSSSSVLSLLQ
jgi:flagellin